MIVEPTLLDHPKFLRLRKKLGLGTAEILLRLWSHCQAEQRGARWIGADSEYVEAVVRWDGENGICFAALVSCGFVDVADKSLVIHDWTATNKNLVNSWSNGRYGGRPKKPTGNPRETHGLSVGNPSVTRGASEKRREEKRRIPPLPPTSEALAFQPSATVSGQGGEEGKASASNGTGASVDEVRAVEAVWAAWPKKSDWNAAQHAILAAIRRRGLDAVLAGTKAIASADRKRNTSPPGHFLPKSVEFFDGDRFLDDPSQYGPRHVEETPQELRRRLEAMAQQLREHPGNPESIVGSMERKKREKPAFEALQRAYLEARSKLGLVGVEDE